MYLNAGRMTRYMDFLKKNPVMSQLHNYLTGHLNVKTLWNILQTGAMVCLWRKVNLIFSQPFVTVIFNKTSPYDMCDDFNFNTTNFSFLSINIMSSPAYGVSFSQLLRYARTWSIYDKIFRRVRRSKFFYERVCNRHLNRHRGNGWIPMMILSNHNMGPNFPDWYSWLWLRGYLKNT